MCEQEAFLLKGNPSIVFLTLKDKLHNFRGTTSSPITTCHSGHELIELCVCWLARPCLDQRPLTPAGKKHDKERDNENWIGGKRTKTIRTDDFMNNTDTLRLHAKSGGLSED